MKKTLKITLVTLLFLSIIVLGSLAIFLRVVIRETSEISLDRDKLLYQTTQLNIYDANDNLTNTENINGRLLVDIDNLQPHTVQAFVSIEDKNFYKHQGVNYKRMLKAMYNNLRAGSIVEGASTITQQLIKNTHLSNEKTFKRKMKEIFLAKKLENKYSKNEIMELYLNVIYFGNGCYGIEEASQTYFGIPAKELTLDQSAILAGMIKSPKTYSPVYNYANCIKRRNLVLNEMKRDGKIKDTQYDEAVSTQTEIIQDNKPDQFDSIYIKSVINEACEILKINEHQLALGNYKIYTYLDVNKQKELFDTMNNSEYYHVNSHGNVADGLGVIVNNKTGGIEAIAGNSKYDLTDLKRQPGSAIKPILVYAPALDNGLISNCTQILDDKINIDGYSPQNVGGTYHGYVSIKDSVADSLNIPAVKTMQYVGIDKCKQFAQNCGINFNDKDNGYALALGGFTDGITLPQLVGSYLPFSNGGKYIPAKFIRKITTKNDITIYQKDEVGKQVMGSDTAFLSTDLLLTGVKEGTSKKLSTLPYQVAGKTGTVAVKGTNLNTDAISVAYTSEHTVGVILCNYSYNPEYHLEGKNNGGTYATALIKETMEKLYANHKPQDFVVPDTVTQLNIDSNELLDNHVIKLASSNCPEKYCTKEYFATRFAPTAVSTNFDVLDVDFEVINNDNTVTVNADLKDYFDYTLMRNNKAVDLISSHDGKYTFEDNDLQENTMYEYYFVITNPYNNQTNQTKKVSVILKDKYQTMLDNELNSNNLSWYFS